jgi:hypothetical protein
MKAAVKRFAGGRLQVTLGIMPARPGNLLARSTRQVATPPAALLMLIIAIGAAWPQGAPPPPTLGVQELGAQELGVQELGVQEQPAPQTAPPQAESAPPVREENPGLFNEIGKMFDRLPSLKSSQQTIDDLNSRAKDAARDATDSLSRLAKPSSMVAGRMICPVSGNGAPDCKLGADKLCQAKGFKEGKSLNTDSAETCSAKVLIPGRTRKPDDCRTDNFVTSALCQ